jgi:cystathionine gamma-synthase
LIGGGAGIYPFSIILTIDVKIENLSIKDYQSFVDGKNETFLSGMSEGDVLYVESPRNCDNLLVDVERLATAVHERKARLVVDSTFATPVLIKPLDLGADVVLHSATKLLGGHSDLLAGVAVTRSLPLSSRLRNDCMSFGCVAGALESWLLLRSLRTLHVRIEQQCSNAASVVRWLDTTARSNGWIASVDSPMLAAHPSHALWLKTYRGRTPPCFSVLIDDAIDARSLRQRLRLFLRCTSLGGVESMCDWRQRWDAELSAQLLRLSIGLEDARDLIADLRQAFESLCGKSAAVDSSNDQTTKKDNDNDDGGNDQSDLIVYNDE